MFMFPKFVLLHKSFLQDYVTLIAFDAIVSTKFVPLKRHFMAQSFITLITSANIPCHNMEIKWTFLCELQTTFLTINFRPMGFPVISEKFSSAERSIAVTALVLETAIWIKGRLFMPHVAVSSSEKNAAKITSIFIQTLHAMYLYMSLKAVFPGETGATMIAIKFD